MNPYSPVTITRRAIYYALREKKYRHKQKYRESQGMYQVDIPKTKQTNKE